jgi:hypothetical protein
LSELAVIERFAGSDDDVSIGHARHTQEIDGFLGRSLIGIQAVERLHRVRSPARSSQTEMTGASFEKSA